MVVLSRRALEVGEEYEKVIRLDRAAFQAVKGNSIDYAVMEKTHKAMMVPLDAGWSDVGSWAALHDVSAKDERGNTLIGDTVAYDCDNTFVQGEGRLVAVAGLKDTIVVETKDSVMVG